MGRLIKESDPRARLLRGAEGLLRHAVELRDLGTDGHGAVQHSLCSLCRVARSRGIPVEQLVVICKDAWRKLPAARALPPDAAAALLKGVISRCIEEYYRTDGTAIVPRQHFESAGAPESSLSFMFGPLS